MIARKDWFQRRKYGGWGISPKTWQGWLYIAFVIIPFAVFQAMPFWDTNTRLAITFVWLGFLFLDTLPVMITLDRDEREYKIEAISERNAAWFMSLVLCGGVFYEVLLSSLNQEPTINIFMVIALLGGALVKTISNIFMEGKKI